jgi:hypothetical protein
MRLSPEGEKRAKLRAKMLAATFMKMLLPIEKADELRGVLEDMAETAIREEAIRELEYFWGIKGD